MGGVLALSGSLDCGEDVSLSIPGSRVPLLASEKTAVQQTTSCPVRVSPQCNGGWRRLSVPGHRQALGRICSCPAVSTLVMYKGLPEGPFMTSSLSYAKLPKLKETMSLDQPL